MAKKKAQNKKGRKRRMKKGSSRPYIIAAVLVAAFFFGALSLFLLDRYADLAILSSKGGTSGEQVASIKLPPPVKPPTVKPTPKPIPELPPVTGRVAIVIDDLGQNLTRFDGLLEVKAPITAAVLPHLKYSAEVSARANDRGWDVLLHAPMEPKNMENHNPGDGVLLTSMGRSELRKILSSGLKTVPHAKGVNNHMGSKFTEDERAMKVVLSLLKERRFFFLDSRTTGSSIAKRLAEKKGVKSARRNVFLDNERNERYIDGQLNELLRIAKKRGYAIAIGHPYPETIAVLKRRLPGLRGEGIEIVKLSELVR